jgi:hypothetical protein
MSTQVIVLNTEHQSEAILDGAATPGMLMEPNSDGTFSPHSTAAGDVTLPYFLLEQTETGLGIDDVIPDGSTGKLYTPSFGDKLYCWLKTGNNVAVGDALESAGDGTLQKLTTGTKVAEAVEAVNNTSGSKERITVNATLVGPASAITPQAKATALTDNSGGTPADTIASVLGRQCGYQFMQNPAAATTTGGATQLDISSGSTGTMLSLVQPKEPRNVKVTITDGDASISAYTLVFTGKSPSGDAVTETFHFSDGLTPTGSVVFASLSSVVISALVGNGAADTLDFGYGSKLGVQVPLGSTSLVIEKLTCDDTIEAASATDTTNNSFTPTTALNGAHDYEVWYSYVSANSTKVAAAVATFAAHLNTIRTKLVASGDWF